MPNNSFKAAKFGDKVMVKYHGLWHKAVVVDADGYSGFNLNVYTEAKIHDTPNLNGHGISVSIKSNDFERGWRN